MGWGGELFTVLGKGWAQANGEKGARDKCGEDGEACRDADGGDRGK